MAEVPEIPAGVEEITAAWMSRALGCRVETLEIEQIGIGVGVASALYRARLTGDGPASVVVKLCALAEEAAFTSIVLRMYIREVRFYQQLAADSPIRVPQCHFGAVDEETSNFVLVLEDMGELRVVDQTSGMSIADAERSIDALAVWHARHWREADELVEQGTAVCLSDPVYPAILPTVFGEGWETVNAELGVADEIAAIGPRWVDKLPTLLTSLSAQPNTVIHGDFRADNILFDQADDVVLLDFQLTGRGSGSYDLAYFVTQSLSPDVAAASERRLFDRWVAGLVRSGVAEADTAHLWDRYREAALFCLVYPIVAARGMDFSDPRQAELISTMNTRFARAVRDLDLADLLA